MALNRTKVLKDEDMVLTKKQWTEIEALVARLQSERDNAVEACKIKDEEIAKLEDTIHESMTLMDKITNKLKLQNDKADLYEGTASFYSLMHSVDVRV